ncbi:uncharacterized protein LOC143132424 isoform X4 [Alosa pseudoharengus]|uniref:uncharacterized protein LOC143132424 isoform X4 n=1 Tax=Alosa pseudoharengus TaxID=34774 RepID=UPI003F8AE092
MSASSSGLIPMESVLLILILMACLSSSMDFKLRPKHIEYKPLKQSLSKDSITHYIGKEKHTSEGAVCPMQPVIQTAMLFESSMPPCTMEVKVRHKDICDMKLRPMEQPFSDESITRYLCIENHYTGDVFPLQPYFIQTPTLFESSVLPCTMEIKVNPKDICDMKLRPMEQHFSKESIARYLGSEKHSSEGDLQPFIQTPTLFESSMPPCTMEVKVRHEDICDMKLRPMEQPFSDESITRYLCIENHYTGDVFPLQPYFIQTPTLFESSVLPCTMEIKVNPKDICDMKLRPMEQPFSEERITRYLGSEKHFSEGDVFPLQPFIQTPTLSESSVLPYTMEIKVNPKDICDMKLRPMQQPFSKESITRYLGSEKHSSEGDLQPFIQTPTLFDVTLLHNVGRRKTVSTGLRSGSFDDNKAAEVCHILPPQRKFLTPQGAMPS